MKGSVLWSETQDKLAEARYFLDQMRRYKNDADIFRFVLSAFHVGGEKRYFDHAEGVRFAPRL